jgi:hypothetical protein
MRVSFLAPKPQLLKQDFFFQWRHWLREFVALPINAFNVVKHRTTALRLVLVFVSI